MDITQLYGTWYKDTSQSSQNCLVLRRKDPQELMWGQQFVFESDGTFADIYAVRCGNDPDYHHWYGNWTFDAATQLLSLQKSPDTPPIIRRAVFPPQSSPILTRFQIKDLSSSIAMLLRLG
ncbi:MAG: hypothetical protein SAJ12_15795 [Jaaginema sp. PMC 1079.18]|nr:hypothetical protein [Jaaginema sp. PMC 1080.18]MEC4852447.1 hypothetical protein [Jaaginema sp. PMC 1079.18]MEC4864532.1 hypothetical protein [Jaaginema sp. PMC 1078.18]